MRANRLKTLVFSVSLDSGIQRILTSIVELWHPFCY